MDPVFDLYAMFASPLPFAEGIWIYAPVINARCNLVLGVYKKNQNHEETVERYVYDASNRMPLGTNAEGETSAYIYDGLGYLVGQS